MNKANVMNMVTPPTMESRPYTVKWEIELEATSPEVAAQIALDIQRDLDSTATAFTATDDVTGEETDIDLSLDT